jgi:hypothetical protein
VTGVVQNTRFLFTPTELLYGIPNFEWISHELLGLIRSMAILPSMGVKIGVFDDVVQHIPIVWNHGNFAL